MSITDELRDWFKDRLFMANGWQEIHDIADRIDAEHEAKVSYWQGASYKDGYDEGFASADDWLGQHEDAMAEHGWVKLPVDADGVPFHIGDKVDSDHYEDGTIIGVHYFRAPNGVVFEEIAVQPNGWDTATWRDPEEYAHHHEPTVEDVLREFAANIADVLGGDDFKLDDNDELYAEYAAKLRLAGDGE